MLLAVIANSLLAADLVTLASAAVIVAADPATRTELVSVGPPQARACAAEVVDFPGGVHGSGRTALRIAGHDAAGQRCITWAAAEVRVERTLAVTTRAIAAGEPLDGAFVLRSVEVKRAAPWRVPGLGAIATRALPAGTALLAHHLVNGLPTGTPLQVLVRSGALSVVAPGQVAACALTDGPDQVCAVLANGRRVRGTLEGGGREATPHLVVRQ